MRDHVWVLFVLADISKHFEERNLPEVAAVIEETIFTVESGILSPSSKAGVSKASSPARRRHGDLSNRSNVIDISVVENSL